jgi:formylglycine-generating enzyme required for sulfatase activity
MAKHTPKFFDIFLSSPGDVPEERDIVEAVVDAINRSGEFANRFTLRLYRWDDKNVVIPMPVTDIPQRSVDSYMTRPSECDLTVVIFWSRMGSPLIMDGREYLSGTHYEYTDAREAYDTHKKPSVWLYRRSEEPSIKLTDPKRDEKVQQFDRVTQFFSQFQDADGRFLAGVNIYPTPHNFEVMFRGQLLSYLRYLRDTPPRDDPSTDGQTDAPDGLQFSGTPYKGLSALDEEDAPIFFGRDIEKLAVRGRVENSRLVFLLGASGSGKSSLAAAGVLPHFRKKNWQIVRCVPGDDPFFNVALALMPLPANMGAKLHVYLKEARDLAVYLGTEPQTLVTELERRASGHRVLLFIDQFEEVFTLAEQNADLSSQATATFIQAIQQSSSIVTTLLTMRADFYGVALPYFDDLKQHAYGLTKPSVFALYEMITRPAQLAGVTFEADLAQRIVDDAGTQSGALALVSYVLEALYKFAQARGDKIMSLEDYTDRLHGVSGAINTLADQAYQQLPFDEARCQAALRRAFSQLIALTEEDGQLIPTRRRVALSDFALDSDETVFIEHFSQARLLVKGEGQTVEVAHEAILMHWGALADWIAQVKGDLALLRQYERDAKTWEQRGKDTPPAPQEALDYFHKALAKLGLAWENLPEPLKSYTEPEVARLLREIKKIETDHKRRRWIGERLATIGDTRTGIGLDERGLPQIDWLLVSPGGNIEIEGHTFEIEPFYVAKHLITYSQFQAFVEASDGFEDNRWWIDFPERYRKQNISAAVAQYSNYPRDSVSWYQAVAFTRWLTEKYREYGVIKDALIALPTEQQWQWMAQNGAEARQYPWGDWDKHPRANTTEAGIGDRSTAVGMYPHGSAECRALDVAGNLWEWCLNDYGKYTVVNGYDNENRKVRRGGSFRDGQGSAAASYRNFSDPRGDGGSCGFRVVLSAPIASLISE